MGTAYEHLSRDELVALLEAQPEPARSATEEPPSSGDRYRQVVEEAADGIFLSDDDGTYLDVNEAGARMLGMTREEVLGKRIRDIVIDAQQETLAAMRARVIAGEWVLHEWQIRRKDGSIFTAEVSAKQLPDGRNQGIWRDVSVRRAGPDRRRMGSYRSRSEAVLTERAEIDRDLTRPRSAGSTANSTRTAAHPSKVRSAPVGQDASLESVTLCPGAG